MTATTSKPKAAPRGRRTTKETDMPTTTVDAASVQPAQPSTALADLLADPTLPRWTAPPHLLDLACCLVHGDERGLDEHREAWRHAQRQREYLDYGQRLRDVADAKLTQARDALDADASAEEAHAMYVAAQTARAEYAAFESAYLALDYPTTPREVRAMRTHRRGQDAANQALAAGLRARRLRVAAFADMELRRMDAATLPGAAPYPLPPAVKRTDLQAAARPLHKAQQRVLDLQDELRRGPRGEPGSRRTADDLRQYLELVELPEAIDRVTAIRNALTPDTA